MKKVFCILSILAIVSPVFQANAADPVPTNSTPATQGTQTAAQVTTTVTPRYSLATADTSNDDNAASAGYVKGAYNAAIKAVNTVADSIPTAQPSDAISGRAAIWIE